VVQYRCNQALGGPPGMQSLTHECKSRVALRGKNNKGGDVRSAQKSYTETGDDRNVGLVENHHPMRIVRSPPVGRQPVRQPLLAAEVMPASLPVLATSTADEDAMEAPVAAMTHRKTPAPVKVSCGGFKHA